MLRIAAITEKNIAKINQTLSNLKLLLHTQGGPIYKIQFHLGSLPFFFILAFLSAHFYHLFKGNQTWSQISSMPFLFSSPTNLLLMNHTSVCCLASTVFYPPVLTAVTVIYSVPSLSATICKYPWTQQLEPAWSIIWQIESFFSADKIIDWMVHICTQPYTHPKRKTVVIVLAADSGFKKSHISNLAIEKMSSNLMWRGFPNISSLLFSSLQKALLPQSFFF